MIEQEKWEQLEKVIAGLEQFIADFKPFCGNKGDWQRVFDALALLKAQEPIRPQILETSLSMKYGGRFRISLCGNCGAMLCEIPKRYKCCVECGRAVKWE